MAYTSYRREVLEALKTCKKEFCEGVGTLVVAEAQAIVVVDTGNLRRSLVYEVMPGNVGVNVGANEGAPYALTIEKGLSNHKAQPFLEPGAMASIPKIVNVAEALYQSKLGGS